ncbi:hypothetical protein [Mammaliicoccus sciuri]|uniref:hypothetical protein n=1 Tax=Mammaliicoccus sciuri TaxID=1296 RepID=UPI000E6A22C6|nr:hypothetical protein [Mammaliicoccus sciuri]RIN80219.1 hypothetical protein BU007_07755 [Mammaliicoccus sciuri]
MPTIKYTREDITKLENERDQLKHQGNLLREDIALLKKNQKTRDKLIDNLKEENKNLNNERDSLIKDVEQKRELLKDFSRFLHRKVEACPGKPEYMDFRDRLNELGIRERE